MDIKGAFEILEIPETGVTLTELKKAYKRKAFIHHPDKGGKQEDFIQVRAAYDFIINRGPSKQVKKVAPVQKPWTTYQQRPFKVHWDFGFNVNVTTTCA